jgi:phosphoribosyl 1,2-cyclic phosphate phosphodiesterase
MKITILGCGASFGVPSITHEWGYCDPTNPKNRRLRSSIFIEDQNTKILVDTGPDLREQLLREKIKAIDGVIYTHSHADHTHGIDDLRALCKLMNKAIPIYGHEETLTDLQKRFPYVFQPLDLGVIYRASLTPHIIENAFQIGGCAFETFRQDHGYSETMGFRTQNFAYSTDVVNLSEEALKTLEGLDLWIVGCLGLHPHPTHAHLDKVLAWVERLKPKQTILTHLSETMDYDSVSKKLPPHVSVAYDGMSIEN